MFGPLLQQFAPMLGMLKGGGNPLGMLSMMGGANSQLSQAIKEATEASKGRDASSFEQFVRSEFSKYGLDVNQIRSGLGI